MQVPKKVKISYEKGAFVEDQTKEDEIQRIKNEREKRLQIKQQADRVKAKKKREAEKLRRKDFAKPIIDNGIFNRVVQTYDTYFSSKI